MRIKLCTPYKIYIKNVISSGQLLDGLTATRNIKLEIASQDVYKTLPSLASVSTRHSTR